MPHSSSASEASCPWKLHPKMPKMGFPCIRERREKKEGREWRGRGGGKEGGQEERRDILENAGTANHQKARPHDAKVVIVMLYYLKLARLTSRSVGGYYLESNLRDESLSGCCHH